MRKHDTVHVCKATAQTKQLVLRQTAICIAMVASAISHAAEYADRPNVTDYDLCVDVGTWCGGAQAERAAVLPKDDVVLPRTDTQAAYLRYIKERMAGTCQSYVDISHEQSGRFDNWFATSNPASGYPATFPLWTEARLCAHVGAPTNWFAYTPLYPAADADYGWISAQDMYRPLVCTYRACQWADKDANGQPISGPRVIAVESFYAATNSCSVADLPLDPNPVYITTNHAAAGRGPRLSVELSAETVRAHGRETDWNHDCSQAYCSETGAKASVRKGANIDIIENAPVLTGLTNGIACTIDRYGCEQEGTFTYTHNYTECISAEATGWSLYGSYRLTCPQSACPLPGSLAVAKQETVTTASIDVPGYRILPYLQYCDSRSAAPGDTMAMFPMIGFPRPTYMDAPIISQEDWSVYQDCSDFHEMFEILSMEYHHAAVERELKYAIEIGPSLALLRWTGFAFK